MKPLMPTSSAINSASVAVWRQAYESAFQIQGDACSARAMTAKSLVLDLPPFLLACFDRCQGFQDRYRAAAGKN
jgi:hypothetical protein